MSLGIGLGVSKVHAMLSITSSVPLSVDQDLALPDLVFYLV